MRAFSTGGMAIVLGILVVFPGVAPTRAQSLHSNDPALPLGVSMAPSEGTLDDFVLSAQDAYNTFVAGPLNAAPGTSLFTDGPANMAPPPHASNALLQPQEAYNTFTSEPVAIDPQNPLPSYPRFIGQVGDYNIVTGLWGALRGAMDGWDVGKMVGGPYGPVPFAIVGATIGAYTGSKRQVHGYALDDDEVTEGGIPEFFHVPDTSEVYRTVQEITDFLEDYQTKSHGDTPIVPGDTQNRGKIGSLDVRAAAGDGEISGQYLRPSVRSNQHSGNNFINRDGSGIPSEVIVPEGLSLSDFVLPGTEDDYEEVFSGPDIDLPDEGIVSWVDGEIGGIPEVVIVLEGLSLSDFVPPGTEDDYELVSPPVQESTVLNVLRENEAEVERLSTEWLGEIESGGGAVSSWVDGEIGGIVPEGQSLGDFVPSGTEDDYEEVFSGPDIDLPDEGIVSWVDGEIGGIPEVVIVPEGQSLGDFVPSGTEDDYELDDW